MMIIVFQTLSIYHPFPFIYHAKQALPYFVNDGRCTGCTDGHGHDSSCDSDRSHNKHLTNTAKTIILGTMHHRHHPYNKIFTELKMLYQQVEGNKDGA